MLKHLGKPTPADGDEIITPEEALELIDKAKKKLIDLKGDELRALRGIAMNSPDYEFEEVSLDPQENKKLDRALDLAEVDVEELKRDFPELYKQLKRDLADVIAATGKVPKTIKASALSPELAQKLAENGIIEFDPAVEELLERKAEEEQQNIHKKAAAMREQLDDAVSKIERQQTDMDDIRRKNQKVYKKLKEFDDQEDMYEGDQLLPSRGRGAAGRGGRRRAAPAPKVNLNDIKETNPQLYREIIDDVLQEYDSVDEIPEQLPLNTLSPSLQKKVADYIKAVESNKELDNISPARVNAMLKHLGKPTPADGDEIITPEEALELIDKAKKKLIDLKGDELRALRGIAMNSPDYEFEEVSLDPQENKKLDRALDLAEVDVEELKRDFPELYKQLKRDLADVIAATGKVPKTIKASALSPELAQKLAENGIIEFDPAVEELLERKAEEEQQNIHKKAAAMREQLDDAVSKIERQQTDMDDIRRKNQKVYKKLKEFDDQEDMYNPYISTFKAKHTPNLVNSLLPSDQSKLFKLIFLALPKHLLSNPLSANLPSTLLPEIL